MVEIERKRQTERGMQKQGSKSVSLAQTKGFSVTKTCLAPSPLPLAEATGVVLWQSNRAARLAQGRTWQEMLASLPTLFSTLFLLSLCSPHALFLLSISSHLNHDPTSSYFFIKVLAR